MIAALKGKYPNPKMALLSQWHLSGIQSKKFSKISKVKRQNGYRPSRSVKDKFDIVLVDESHRLRRRVNLVATLKPLIQYVKN
jgi:hypothetical protein